jgi:hypothetical protein
MLRIDALNYCLTTPGRFAEKLVLSANPEIGKTRTGILAWRGFEEESGEGEWGLTRRRCEETKH